MMEQKMETASTIEESGYWGITIGIMEKKMETTIFLGQNKNTGKENGNDYYMAEQFCEGFSSDKP